MSSSNPTLESLLRWARQTIVEHGHTPVLITPDHIRLRSAFYIELARCWTDQASKRWSHGTPGGAGERPPTLQIDWCPLPGRFPGGLGSLSSLYARRIGWSLRRHRFAPAVRFTRCFLPGRVTATAFLWATGPGGMSAPRQANLDRPFVLGIANESFALPAWAAPLRLVA